MFVDSMYRHTHIHTHAHTHTHTHKFTDAHERQPLNSNKTISVSTHLDKTIFTPKTYLL